MVLTNFPVDCVTSAPCCLKNAALFFLRTELLAHDAQGIVCLDLTSLLIVDLDLASCPCSRQCLLMAWHGLAVPVTHCHWSRLPFRLRCPYRFCRKQGSPFTYLVIAVWLGTTVFWLMRMNRALAMFHGLFIIPALQVTSRSWAFALPLPQPYHTDPTRQTCTHEPCHVDLTCQA